MSRKVGWIVLRNVLLAALAFFVFLTILFIFLQLQPGELSDIYVVNPRLPQEDRPVLIHRLGLDRPGIAQYLAFLQDVLSGNLGVSFSLYPRPVWEIIKERLPRSLFLLTLGLLLAIPLGNGLERLFRSRWSGNGNRFIALGVYAVFLPWLVLLLIWAFAFKLGLFPIGKFITPTPWLHHRGIMADAVFRRIFLATFLGIAVGWGCWLGLRQLWQRRLIPHWGTVLLGLFLLDAILRGVIAIMTKGLPAELVADVLVHMVLPFITLTLEMSVFYALIVRSDLFRFRAFDKRSFTPFFALFLALSCGALFNVETIHSWPGMGMTMLSAILSEDMPLAVGVFIYIVVALIVFNMAMAIYRGLKGLLRGPEVQQVKLEPRAEPRKRARWPLWVAAALLLAFVGMTVAHPLLLDRVWDPAIYDPVTGYQAPTDEQLLRGLNNPLPPSSAHPLGTDPWGRDVLSQLLYSARLAFVVGGLAGLIAMILGLAAALLLRAMEGIEARPAANIIIALGCALLALPLLPLFLFASSMVSLDLNTLALWIGLLAWPLVLFIIRDIDPNSIRLLPALAGGFLYIMAFALGIEAVLSFYGLLNIQFSWGIMEELASISGYLVGSAVTRYWWLFWPASLAIALFGFSAYLLGWELKAQAQLGPRQAR